MVKNLLLVVMFAAAANAVAAVNANPATITTVAAVAAAVDAENRGVVQKNQPLDKTWTTGVQENEAGSQVLDITTLTSLMSFQAKRTGFLEPGLLQSFRSRQLLIQ